MLFDNEYVDALLESKPLIPTKVPFFDTNVIDGPLNVSNIKFICPPEKVVASGSVIIVLLPPLAVEFTL